MAKTINGYKKKWGDRSDGRRVKVPGLQTFMINLWPNRTDCEVYLHDAIDVTELMKYVEKKKAEHPDLKTTFFHCVIAAAAKMVNERPLMNRFIQGRRTYERFEISVAFVAKLAFEDHAEEALAFFQYDPRETLESYHEKIMKIIHASKSETEKDVSTGAMDVITKLPQWMINAIVKTVLWLDKHGWAPEFLIGSDSNHASIFLTNLGSIGLPGGYHHLVNWGTNSCFIVVGKKYRKADYDAEGNADVHEVIPVGITLDERIADGYYYSGTVALVKELLAHPELLELPADSPVEYSIRR